MRRGVCALAAAVLLVLGGCASWPEGDAGSGSSGGYERSGGY